MSQKVCRACFIDINAQHYIALNNKSEIPGYETVQDAFLELVPSLVEHVT